MRDIVLRTALWEVHNHLCAYCGELVPFPEMQADHIIPATLRANHQELTRVLTGLGLPATSDLDDIWNRLLSHGRCNRLKSDDLLSVSNVRFFLEVAAKAQPKVSIEAERLRAQARSDRIKAAVAIAITSGQVSVDEVVRSAVAAGTGPALIARSQTHGAAARLIEAVASGTSISELLNMPLLPREHGLDELSMCRGGERVAVLNCADWAARRRDGFFPTTNYDIKEEVFFKNAYATLRALEIALPSVASFLPSTCLGTLDAAILPASLLPYLSPDEQVKVTGWGKRGVSLLDLSRTDGVVLEGSQDGFKITWNFMTAYVREIMRADLDGDGVEDLLYTYYARVHQGTFAAGHVGVFTRRSKDGMMETIEVPAMNP